MSPLKIESLVGSTGNWIKVSEIKPGDKRRHVEILPDWKKNVYVFGCEADDSSSKIRVAKDVPLKKEATEFQTIRRLRPGESYERDFRIGPRAGKRRLRFTHTQPSPKA